MQIDCVQLIPPGVPQVQPQVSAPVSSAPKSESTWRS
jgi:hypothetical protein